jgi:signal transduction histidine kinase
MLFLPGQPVYAIIFPYLERVLMTPADSGSRTERLERLIEVSRRLGASLELDSLFSSVVEAACDLTGSQASTILLYEEETDLLKFVAGSQVDPEVIKRVRIPLEQSVAGRVYTQNLAAIVENAQGNPLVFKDIERALNIKVHSIMAVPMVFRGEPIGVIETLNKAGGKPYSQDDVAILETLASQAAVSILSTLMLDEMNKAYEELEDSEKKKTDFIAIASHELRTPLGLILGYSSELYENCKDASLRPQLDMIVRSANRLKKIIEDFSNVSGFQTGKARIFHRKLSMTRLIRDVVTSFQQAALDKHISLMMRLPQTDLMLEGDSEKLILALSNLVENGLTFTDRSGHVLVTAERLPGYLKVSVIDDGIGIPAKDLGRVFERFYQVESHLTRHHGGMGLGLSVAKAMIELHGGQIWVESVEGKGSNFSFLLPMKDEVLPKKTPAFIPDGST